MDSLDAFLSAAVKSAPSASASARVDLSSFSRTQPAIVSDDGLLDAVAGEDDMLRAAKKDQAAEAFVRVDASSWNDPALPSLLRGGAPTSPVVAGKDGDLANAAALRDQEYQRRASEKDASGVPSHSAVASIFAQLRAGSASRPDAGVLERMRVGRQRLKLENLERVTVKLQHAVQSYVRAPIEHRHTQCDHVVSAVNDANRALRDTKSVIKSSSTGAALTAYQQSAMALDRSVRAIDGVGNAQRPESLDISMSRMKKTLGRAMSHMSGLFDALLKIARP